MSFEPCGFPSFHLICGLKADPSRWLKDQQGCLYPQCPLFSTQVWGSPTWGPGEGRGMLPHTGLWWEPGPEQFRRIRYSGAHEPGMGQGMGG